MQAQRNAIVAAFDAKIQKLQDPKNTQKPYLSSNNNNYKKKKITITIILIIFRFISGRNGSSGQDSDRISQPSSREVLEGR